MRYQPEYDPANDEGNPYQHLLDDDCDDCEEDIRLGLSVYGMTKGLARPAHKEEG